MKKINDISENIKVNTEKKQTDSTAATPKLKNQPSEHGGPKGLEPTRYGDWERKGRCIDF